MKNETTTDVRSATRVLVLAENTAAYRNVRGEHGLAFLIQREGRTLLFDTGQGLVLPDNVAVLRVDLRAVDTVVLSHGHYDHTGGLAWVLRQTAPQVTVYAHPDALVPKYKRTRGDVEEIGMPASCREALSRPGCHVACSREAREILPGVWATGEIPRRHPEEQDAGEGFCADPNGREDDPLLDDQSLFMATPRGTVVLLGCAHAGVINILDHVQALTGRAPICAVAGGMHLRSITPARLAWTIEQLKRFSPRRLAAMHCTGPAAVAALWHAFPGVGLVCGVGTWLEF